MEWPRGFYEKAESSGPWSAWENVRLWALPEHRRLMDRERMMGIAAISPSVEEPGNAVDRLVGPWIEIVGPDIFRISPLIKSAGQQVNGLAWARNMNGSIAQAFLARRSLTPGDVSA